MKKQKKHRNQGTPPPSEQQAAEAAEKQLETKAQEKATASERPSTPEKAEGVGAIRLDREKVEKLTEDFYELKEKLIPYREMLESYGMSEPSDAEVLKPGDCMGHWENCDECSICDSADQCLHMTVNSMRMMLELIQKELSPDKEENGEDDEGRNEQDKQ